MVMGIEQRKQKRVILRRHVLINNLIKAMGLDLSEGGIYIHTGRNFPQGSNISLSVPLGNMPFTVKGRVQHAQSGVGMGIMFVDLTDGQKQTLREFIDANAADSSQEESRKKVVLIVDDNAVNRRMYRSKLVLDGFGVLEADDGLAALEVLNKEKVDLLVLDLYMQKLDGFKMLSILRQKPEWQDLPVLVFSARSSPDEIEKAMNAGATEFLIKMTTSPVKLSEHIKVYFNK